MVIMPNHIHGILCIDNDAGMTMDKVDDMGNDVDGRDVACNSTAPTASPPVTPSPQKNIKMAKISPKRGSILTVIRSFKSVVTKKSYDIQSVFVWQPNYYDHLSVMKNH